MIVYCKQAAIWRQRLLALTVGLRTRAHWVAEYFSPVPVLKVVIWGS